MLLVVEVVVAKVTVGPDRNAWGFLCNEAGDERVRITETEINYDLPSIGALR